MIFITQDSELDIKHGMSIIYFYAPWLLFHNKISEYFIEIEKEFQDIKLYAIDIDQFNGLVTRFNILSLPTILIVKDEGKLIKNVTGMLAISGIGNIIRDIYKSYTNDHGDKK